MDPILAEVYSTVLPAAPFVIAAYVGIWLALFVFVFALSRRAKRTSEDLDALRDALDARWRGRFRTAVSGATWFDFNSTDKGGGLRRLCARLGVGLGEVLAFGDSGNDLPMLRAAGTAYIMSNAAPSLLALFPRRCSDVEQVLKGLV